MHLQYMIVRNRRQKIDIKTQKGVIKTTSEDKYLSVILTRNITHDKYIRSKMGHDEVIIRQLHCIIWSKNNANKIK